jgi:hypothetical protein
MTAQQTQELNQAMANYLSAEATFTAEQSAAAAAGQVVNDAQTNLANVKSQNAASLQAATDKFFSAQSAQQAAIKGAQDATVALGTAQVALDQAIVDSRQTGAQEVIPPNQVAGAQV